MADTYAGKFLLAKVNTDNERELAMTYGIRSLPTVKIFRNGEVVDEFMGAQPESTIRQIIDRHVSRESDTMVEAALLAHREGKTEEALEIFKKNIETFPEDSDVYNSYAEALAVSGDFIKAKIYYQKALEINANNQNASEILRHLN